MCRPVRGSHAEVCPGGHIGPPLRGGEAFRSNENRSETMPFPAGRDGARPLQGTGAGRRQGALRVWLPPAKFRNGIWGVSHRYRPLRPAGDGTPGSSCPTGGCGEPPRLPGPAAHSEASALRSRGNGWELQQGSSPKGPSTSDNPSVTAFGRASSLCTREPWSCGKMFRR